MTTRKLSGPALIAFARAYATGYYDGRTQGVEYNTYRDDQRHAYRLGYDAGVADYCTEIDAQAQRQPEDRPPASFMSAQECAIDEQAAMYDDPWRDE